MVQLPIALTTAGAAAIINFWIALRVGRARGAAKVSIGDGGNPQLIARMRAHANFVEYAPFVVILIALIEFTIGSALWLWIVSGVFLLGRVAHPFGMDGTPRARSFGTITTMLTLLGLGLYAATLPLISAHSTGAPAVEAAPLRG
ncbi:MAPEG family protein [Sphingomonas sp. GlSt437]|uniref:MAPEG family protein n=1 Tax=Sphingomonas sp. GlSt437 TaxID=3389970 RepID=UPI003A83562A